MVIQSPYLKSRRVNYSKREKKHFNFKFRPRSDFTLLFISIRNAAVAVRRLYPKIKVVTI